ncbi:hypothetical protein chiPu_0017227 [Chiloscyllium punctatum]|uniref:Uncharacterized protein n=1 Tax=Chiloscyllium punctatum TaxID=137246 RepID=A0A401T7R5_CHIPU|nr:hypothetical protein [Chiloscyllium punctatum]
MRLVSSPRWRPFTSDRSWIKDSKLQRTNLQLLLQGARLSLLAFINPVYPLSVSTIPSGSPTLPFRKERLRCRCRFQCTDRASSAHASLLLSSQLQDPAGDFTFNHDKIFPKDVRRGRFAVGKFKPNIKSGYDGFAQFVTT